MYDTTNSANMSLGSCMTAEEKPPCAPRLKSHIASTCRSEQPHFITIYQTIFSSQESASVSTSATVHHYSYFIDNGLHGWRMHDSVRWNPMKNFPQSQTDLSITWCIIEFKINNAKIQSKHCRLMHSLVIFARWFPGNLKMASGNPNSKYAN